MIIVSTCNISHFVVVYELLFFSNSRYIVVGIYTLCVSTAECTIGVEIFGNKNISSFSEPLIFKKSFSDLLVILGFASHVICSSKKNDYTIFSWPQNNTSNIFA